MNNLNLIESRIDTFLKVHNALIHPNYYDTNLNLKSQQHQLNEMNFDLKRLTLNTQNNNSLLSDKYGSTPNKDKKEDQLQNPTQVENPKILKLSTYDGRISQRNENLQSLNTAKSYKSIKSDFDIIPKSAAISPNISKTPILINDEALRSASLKATTKKNLPVLSSELLESSRSQSVDRGTNSRMKDLKIE